MTDRASASRKVPGVYGLQLRGLGPSALLSQVDAEAPLLDVSIELGRVNGRAERFEGDSAEISLIEDGWVSLSRSGRAHFVIADAVPAEEIVHPWLVPAAATFNGWCGRQVLHGGAYARGGRGVALLGNKEDGKSSLLAWLAREGEVEILTDDLIVLEGGAVFSGPRCIDLRPGSVEAVGGSGADLVRGATRLRLNLPPCSASAKLTAIVVLRWGDGPGVSLKPLTASQGIASLLPHALNSGHGDRLLEFLETPVWALVRPRTWASMREVARQLLSLVP